jgi:hypothetical protein
MKRLNNARRLTCACLGVAAMAMALPAQAQADKRNAAPASVPAPQAIEAAMLQMSATSRCGDECVVRDAPFTAERHFASEQLLADGNRISTERVEKIYRDAKGRTRVESEWLNRPLVQIQDPVAGVSYRLYPHSRSGLMMRLNAAPVVPKPAPAPTGVLAAGASAGAAKVAQQLAPALLASSAAKDGDAAASKALGGKSMEGVSVEGVLRTSTVPAGTAGNALPIVQTYEVWRSPELRMAIQWRSVDPRTGERSMRITKLARQEPPAALFAAPGDYTLREVAGPR